ncbi:MAG: PhzF family phenazine biosynthesis protein [Acidobacteriia bacterium]|nr:PhzF family phenazine biosynthesis protein [Terriglobia bacterium]
MSGWIPFYLVDVFAREPLAGNPLAVVPDAARLDTATMASVAREFNQSETTFLLPATRDGADWRLRSFTAAGTEVFGAGHNSLGAWWWLAEAGRLPLGESGGSFVQEIGDRLLPVDVTCEGGRLVSVGLTQTAPVFGRICDAPAALAAALGVEAADFATGRLPIQVVSTGAAHMLAPMRDRAAIARARPDSARLAAVLRAHGAQGCYLFSLDPLAPGAVAHARFFNPVEGIPEDAATGSAAGPLACHLAAHGVVEDGSTVAIEQGYEMGRPSVIEVRIAGRNVRVSGAGVVVAEGRLRTV